MNNNFYQSPKRNENDPFSGEFLKREYCQVENDQKILNNSIFSLIFYFAMFFFLGSIVIIVLQQIYISTNGITKEILTEGHPLYLQTIDNINNFSQAFGNLSIYLISAIVVVILMRKAIIKDFQFLKQKSFLWVLGCIGLGILIFWICNFVSNIFIMILNIEQEAGNEESIVNIMTSSSVNLIVMSLATIILAPILEEIIFRKCLFNILGKKLSPIWVILISGLIFGSIHIISPVIEAITNVMTNDAKPITIFYQFVYLFVYGLMGVGLGFTYQYSKRNLVPCIIVHMINNFISVLFTIIAFYLI